MVEYKIVKYCRLCKERYVVSKGEAKKFYCDKCYARMNNPNPTPTVKEEEKD